MGTINYKTSDYITLGIEPLCSYDIEHDEDFLSEVIECYGNYDGAITDYITDIERDLYDEAEAILNKYSFYYFHIKLDFGYYAGFYLDIENNFPVFYDDYIEKREAQKEITQIKKCLKDLAGVGLIQVSPGWCTGYSTYKDTLTGIDAAIKAMRAEVNLTPTWSRYENNY